MSIRGFEEFQYIRGNLCTCPGKIREGPKLSRLVDCEALPKQEVRLRVENRTVSVAGKHQQGHKALNQRQGEFLVPGL